MRKMCLVLATIVAVNAVNLFDVNASSDYVKRTQMIEKLMDAGYYKETAEALSDDEVKNVYESISGGKDVSIATCATEVDNLHEIESFLSCTEDELIKMGANKNEIKETKKTLDELFRMKDSEMIKEYGIDKTEVKALRKTKENAEKNKLKNTDEKKIKNEVNASGSISSSKLTYTQTVVNNSTKKKPNYRATLSYSWKEAYILAPFKDEIVVGWGGSFEL